MSSVTPDGHAVASPLVTGGPKAVAHLRRPDEAPNKHDRPSTPCARTDALSQKCGDSRGAALPASAPMLLSHGACGWLLSLQYALCECPQAHQCPITILLSSPGPTSSLVPWHGDSCGWPTRASGRQVVRSGPLGVACSRHVKVAPPSRGVQWRTGLRHAWLTGLAAVATTPCIWQRIWIGFLFLDFGVAARFRWHSLPRWTANGSSSGSSHAAPAVGVPPHQACA